MTSLYNARHVVPADVTAADLAEICNELNLNPNEPSPDDFFQAGTTYTRRIPGGTETFRVALIAWLREGVPVALGYLPVNLGGARCWEFGCRSERDWARGWTVDASAGPNASNPTTEGV